LSLGIAVEVERFESAQRMLIFDLEFDRRERLV